MSEQTVAVNKAHQEQVACLLVPMQGMQLLLPNVAVAEVVSYADLESVDGMPPWFLGKLMWRGVELPVLCYEKLNRNEDVADSANRRVAVLNGVSGLNGLSFYAMLVQGIPRLHKVREQDIAEEADDYADKGACESVRVILNGSIAFIPDLDMLEQAVHRTIAA